jgi:hypothetical protein
MTTNDQIANLISDIWYQHPFWPSTFSECINDGCSDYARGGRDCKECLKKQLSALTSEEFATEFFQLLGDVRRCEHKLVYGETKKQETKQ